MTKTWVMKYCTPISLFRRRTLSQFPSHQFMATTVTLPRRCILILCILCPIMTVICHPTLSVAAPAVTPLPSSILLSSCVIDENCDAGYFCHSRTKSCVPCLVEECEEKWKRLSGSSSCIRSQNECGNCIQGYSAQHGHCQPISPSLPHVFEQSDDNANNNTGGSNTPNVWELVFGLIAALLVLGTASPLLVYWFRRREQRHFVRSIDKEETDDQHVERPPPYNPDMSEDLRFLFCDENEYHPNRAVVGRWNDAIQVPPCEVESSTTAIAYNTGNFPTVLAPSAESVPPPGSPAEATVSEQNTETNTAAEISEVEVPLVDASISQVDIASPVEIEGTAQLPAQGAQPPETIAQDNQENSLTTISSSSEVTRISVMVPSVRTRSASGTLSPSVSHPQSTNPSSPVLQPSSSGDSGHFSLNPDQDSDESPFLHISFSVNLEVWPVLDVLSTLHAPPPISPPSPLRLDLSRTIVDLSALEDLILDVPMDINEVELDPLDGVVPNVDCPDELMDLYLYQDQN